jgi:hypothetical protein
MAEVSALTAKIDYLFDTNPFSFDAQDRTAFLESFKACAEIHYNSNPYIQAMWNKKSIKPNMLTTEKILEDVPYVMVNLFKETEQITGPKSEIVLNLTSSGTGGQKSQIFLNQGSLDRVKKSAFMIHQYLGMTSDEEVNYLCFTYDPAVATKLGTAFTDELLTSFTRKRSVFYAIRWSEVKGDFELDVDGVVKCLESYSKDSCPARILGFPAHLYKILKDRNVHFKMPTNSWAQTGGGWKGFVNEEVPKEKFREFVSKRLGVEQSHIRDMFGMVEHGIPYCDCAIGNLHIPNYARVFIRSPRDLSILKKGDVGLIQFLCSYITSYPSFSLLTTDYGRISNCSCGLGGDVLEIIGRAGVAKHKGCALSASKLLEDAS